MKNIDRVRKMSAEELLALFGTCYCPPNKPHCVTEDDDRDCYRCWMQWLNKEAES